MIIYVDIDETICKTNSLDYRNSVPIKENIEKINELFAKGHYIVYWSARGSGSGKDWREVTERQFKEWEIEYHELKFGKPIYDVFICDKAVNIDDLSLDDRPIFNF
jgi:dTDP-glucose 4,6-dehydratase